MKRPFPGDQCEGAAHGLIGLGTLLVAACVSVGVIPWVGLVVPMARLLVGANHQRSLAMSIVMGGGFLPVDNLART